MTKQDRINALLAELEAEGANLGSYEENLDGRMSAGAQRAMNAIKATGNLGSSRYQFPFVAQFDVTITRLTTTIAQDLDFVVFGVRDAENAFANVVSLGTGTTLGVRYGANVDEPSRLKMLYTNGANNDIVEVKCSQYPYPSLLSASLVDRFTLSGIRYSISDTTLTDQFSKKFNTYFRTMFGKNESNSISLASFKNPEQFQSGIIDVPVTWDVHSESGIVGAIRQTAGFTVTLSLFVSSYNKLK